MLMILFKRGVAAIREMIKRGATSRLGTVMPETTENLLALITKLKAQFDASPDALQMTADLTEADYHLMGKLIQLYCFADLNARRIIDALRHAALGPDAMNASRLRDAQVFPKLREAAGLLLEPDLKEGILKAADTIELHRDHRHKFAHWAARRMAGHNALVLFTVNAREAERQDGEAQGPDELKYAIMPLDGFDKELSKLGGHTQYLAETAAYIERHFKEFQERFAQAK